ncbi:MAG: response regulator [Leptospira sp.]|nr:response regulator [Leptospira sp.]
MQKQLQSILIVEDEEDIIEILRIALSINSNFHLIFARSGKEGLDRAKLEAPDLILIDVLMPGMNGLTLSEELKKEDKTKQIPIIFITSRVQKNEILEYKAKGAIGVIEKPFAPMEIVTKIRGFWGEVSTLLY